MGNLFKNRKRSVLVILAIVAAVCIVGYLFMYSGTEVGDLQAQLDELSSQEASISEENARYEHILNGEDEREQYEYQARELGYGYPDETKVINVTPGN